MATTITRRVLFENHKRLVVSAEINADTASELTDGVVVDFSADVTQPPPPYAPVTKLAIQRLIVTGAVSWRGILEFDATTDVPILSFDPANSPIDLDFSAFGGIKDSAGTGYTGDILLTTSGVTIQENTTLIFHLTKHT